MRREGLLKLVLLYARRFVMAEPRETKIGPYTKPSTEEYRRFRAYLESINRLKTQGRLLFPWSDLPVELPKNATVYQEHPLYRQWVALRRPEVFVELPEEPPAQPEQKIVEPEVEPEEQPGEPDIPDDMYRQFISWMVNQPKYGEDAVRRGIYQQDRILTSPEAWPIFEYFSRNVFPRIQEMEGRATEVEIVGTFPNIHIRDREREGPGTQPEPTGVEEADQLPYMDIAVFEDEEDKTYIVAVPFANFDELDIQTIWKHFNNAVLLDPETRERKQTLSPNEFITIMREQEGGDPNYDFNKFARDVSALSVGQRITEEGISAYDIATTPAIRDRVNQWAQQLGFMQVGIGAEDKNKIVEDIRRINTFVPSLTTLAKYMDISRLSPATLEQINRLRTDWANRLVSGELDADMQAQNLRYLSQILSGAGAHGAALNLLGDQSEIIRSGQMPKFLTQTLRGYFTQTVTPERIAEFIGGEGVLTREEQRQRKITLRQVGGTPVEAALVQEQEREREAVARRGGLATLERALAEATQKAKGLGLDPTMEQEAIKKAKAQAVQNLVGGEPITELPAQREKRLEQEKWTALAQRARQARVRPEKVVTI